MSDDTKAIIGWGLGPGAAIARLREALASTRDRIARPSNRGLAFWLVTVVLALLLPAPVAIAVIVARVRRAPPPRGEASSPRVAS